MTQPKIKSMTVEIFDVKSNVRQLRALAGKPDVKPIYDHADALGFTPLEGAANLQGFRRTYVPEKPVVSGQQKLQKLEVSYQIQELRRRGSKDKAAVVITSFKGVGVKEAVEIDARLVIAPEGDVAKTTEFKLNTTKTKVVPTKSWWTRFKGCIKSKCTSVCVSALVSCPFTSWAAYLGCLAAKCGGCSAKCVGCASCKCRWWCKWAVGCCD
jgi:hypothetical protein